MEIPDGPFLFGTVAALGWSRHDLRCALTERRIRRVLHGVYTGADLEDSPALRFAAAKLVLAHHAVVSDRSAAWLHGIDAFDPGALAHPPRLEVVSPASATRVRREGVLGGSRALLREDVQIIDGVAVTTPVRTAADLACLRGRSAAFAAMCAFARHHGVSRADLVAIAERYKGRRGVTQLRALAPLVTGQCESPREAWTLLAIVDAGLPIPEPQVEIDVPGYGRVRLDLAYRLARIAVEYDGEEHHSSPEEQVHDEERRQALRDAGWAVIVVRKGQLSGPALDGWLAELRGALDATRPKQVRVSARAPREIPRRQVWR
ncbi:hypothetical protein [Nocardioides cavernaquae]|uniref:hypothetical protein n=1 Tax=Nocardioides cavernaquae TaxID=2321396 RepID=UPI00160316B9|nr:hypothetical protein [Nocardioides cavernaquae]